MIFSKLKTGNYFWAGQTTYLKMNPCDVWCDSYAISVGPNEGNFKRILI